VAIAYIAFVEMLVNTSESASPLTRLVQTPVRLTTRNPTSNVTSRVFFFV